MDISTCSQWEDHYPTSLQLPRQGWDKTPQHGPVHSEFHWLLGLHFTSNWLSVSAGCTKHETRFWVLLILHHQDFPTWTSLTNHEPSSINQPLTNHHWPTMFLAMFLRSFLMPGSWESPWPWSYPTSGSFAFSSPPQTCGDLWGAACVSGWGTTDDLEHRGCFCP